MTNHIKRKFVERKECIWLAFGTGLKLIALKVEVYDSSFSVNVLILRLLALLSHSRVWCLQIGLSLDCVLELVICLLCQKKYTS